MRVTQLLRKRLHVHIGFIEPTLGSVQAAGGEPSTPQGFTASFGIGNLIAISGLALTLIGGFVELESKIVMDDAKITALQDQSTKYGDSQARLYARFNTEVVSRADIEARFNAVQQNQLQIYSTLLAKGCER